MNPTKKQAIQAVQQSKLALKRGDKSNARRYAETAASLDPNVEEPWLILAALGSPRASIAYLNKALEINPDSAYARQGMHWAINRLRENPPESPHQHQIISQTISPDAFTRVQPVLFPWAILLILFAVGIFYWFSTPTLSFALTPKNIIALVNVNIQKSTYTPTPTATFTPTPTFTPSPTPTYTPSPTPTLTETATLVPTESQPKKDKNPKLILPSGVNKGEFWIDVNLSQQRVYAYKGKNLLSSFLVSTGTWRYPTVTGQYRIYVKYRYANMAGPGYFLPNVPYVMYFYKGYGLHGTYWHNNFGTPMSHGCVNLRTEDAGWVFNLASVGTVVNVHY